MSITTRAKSASTCRIVMCVARPEASEQDPVNKTITWLTPGGDREWFPPIDQALDEPEGLLAAGGDLSVGATAGRLSARHLSLVFGRSAGVVVVTQSARSAAAQLNSSVHAVWRKHCEIEALRWFSIATSPPWCAPAPRGAKTPRERGSRPRCTRAYCELHAHGHAHSVEVRLNGELVGGLYGVLLGRVFFGESMFSRERDASKTALARLVERGIAAGLELIDCQLPTPHLRTLGSRPVSRREFSALVASLAAVPDVALFRAPENCSRSTLFWQNSPPSHGATGCGCRKKMRFKWKAKSSRLCLTQRSG